MTTEPSPDSPATSPRPADTPPYKVVEATRGWRNLDLRELLEYRDLFFFLVWRSLKVRYAQSVLGIGWAVIQPLAQMVVYTVIFGYFVAVESDGVPYPVFAYSALLPWTLFSASLTEAVDSLVAQTHLVSKIYFPRLLLPLAAVSSRLVDFAISAVILAALLAWYGIRPTAAAVALPLLVIVLVIFASGMGMWLSALAIQYRDARYAMGFGVQLFMYAAPIVYPVALVPERFQAVYALNPLVGVIEGFRAGLLGTGPLRWDWITTGTVVAGFIFVSGVVYFRSKERLFADVA